MLLLGCQSPQSQNQAGGQSTPAPTVSAGEVKQQVGEAVNTTKDYVLQQSEPYRQELERKLADFDRQLAEWRPKIEEAGAAAQERLRQEMAALEKQRAELQKQLDSLKAPTQQALQDVKAGLDQAVREMDAALKKATARFTNKDDSKAEK